MNTKEKIAVMQASMDGKEIEYQFIGSMEHRGWRPVHTPSWDWGWL